MYLKYSSWQNKTASPQTHFGLYNIGSEMLWDRVKEI